MALPQNLNTNEIKSAAGAEVEFTRSGGLPNKPNSVRFIYAGASPAYPITMYVSHEETGSGLTLVRKSLVSFDRTIAGQIDITKQARIRMYGVLINPIGQLSSLTAPTEVMANFNSFMSSLGASTTILYDGTGSGSAAMLAGTL
jgi:hypothetical protein